MYECSGGAGTCYISTGVSGLGLASPAQRLTRKPQSRVPADRRYPEGAAYRAPRDQHLVPTRREVHELNLFFGEVHHQIISHSTIINVLIPLKNTLARKTFFLLLLFF